MEWSCLKCEERDRDSIGRDGRSEPGDKRDLHGKDAPEQDRVRGVVYGKVQVGLWGRPWAETGTVRTCRDNQREGLG